MIASFSTLLLSAATLTAALPALEVRTVTALNTAAFEEAQQRDATATRAFSSTTIKTSDGKCLLVNELSGDFRANLTPIQVADCDGSTGQAWDIITAGKHDDQAGTMLVVNTLTQACMNFDPRRAAGNTVIMFSCGGRADGGGAVTNSQLFNFTGGSGPLSLAPLNAVGTCLAVTSANVLDQAPCSSSDSTQSFTFGGSSAPVSALASTTESDVATSTSAEAGASETAVTASTTGDAAAASSTDCNSTTMITVTRGAASASSASTPTSSSESAATTSAAEVGNIPDFSPTSAVPVSRAGGVLQPSAVAESNARDDTAVRAFSSVSIKSSTGQCLFIDPTAGDFRENLIPISVVDCTGSANEQFDLITSGAHNNAENSTLIVSSLTQGCVNFDARRATGDTVIMFSCGGRADGSGETTNSQLFPFSGNGITNIVLAPENDNGATCLVVNGAKLDSAPCSGDASQVFTIG